MTTDGFLLSFELSQDGDELSIHFDDLGLNNLISVLLQIKEKAGHEHLMTPSWGGNELSEDRQSEESRLLNRITLHKW
ncbi:immunity protein 32 [bacterium SCSIO 12696]|nr:immunity protein 32 [bacterium SCSIO 12696]